MFCTRRKNIKFKELYSERGEKRPYVLGEDGQEYFFYQDRTGYTIREMSLDDIHEWYKMMRNDGRNLSSIQRACDLAAISAKVEEMVKEESKIKSMIIFNPAGKMIGGVDFFEDEKSKAEIKVYLRDQQLIDWKGKKIIPVIKRLEEETLIYDELWAIDQEGELTKIS